MEMKRADYPAPIRLLIDQLRRLPGVGIRSAERIGLWLVHTPDARGSELAAAIQAASAVHACATCGFFAEGEQCEICLDATRDPAQLCVVERATDVLSIERTGHFRGRYHALGGRLSPLDHVGPDDLRMDALLGRVRGGGVTEIILALSSDVEGEATASYVAEILEPTGVRLTRLAQGMPAGGGLDHADELTLARALDGRTSYGEG